MNAIDHNGQRIREADMTQVFRLLDGRLTIQNVLPYAAFSPIRIDCHIADAQRSQILEEVRTLARVDLIAVKA